MHHKEKSSQHILRAMTTAVTVVILLAILMSLSTGTAQGASVGSDALARRLVDMGGVDRGLCAVIGGQRELPVQIAQCSNLLVHVREPDASLHFSQIGIISRFWWKKPSPKMLVRALVSAPLGK